MEYFFEGAAIYQLLLADGVEDAEDYVSCIFDESVAEASMQTNFNTDCLLRFCRRMEFVRQYPKAREKGIVWPMLPNTIGGEIFLTYFPGYHQCGSLTMQGGPSLSRYREYLAIVNQAVRDDPRADLKWRCNQFHKKDGPSNRLSHWKLIVINDRLLFSGSNAGDRGRRKADVTRSICRSVHAPCLELNVNGQGDVVELYGLIDLA